MMEFICCFFDSVVRKPYLMQHNAVLCEPLQWKHNRFLLLHLQLQNQLLRNIGYETEAECMGRVLQLKHTLIFAKYSYVV